MVGQGINTVKGPKGPAEVKLEARKIHVGSFTNIKLQYINETAWMRNYNNIACNVIKSGTHGLSRLMVGPQNHFLF